MENINQFTDIEDGIEAVSRFWPIHEKYFTFKFISPAGKEYCFICREEESIPVMFQEFWSQLKTIYITPDIRQVFLKLPNKEPIQWINYNE